MFTGIYLAGLFAAFIGLSQHADPVINTILPVTLHLSADNTSANMSCRADLSIAGLAICKMTIFKTSYSVSSLPGMAESKRPGPRGQFVAVVSTHALVGRPPTAIVTGSTSAGELTWSVQEMTCDTRGHYVCNVTYVSGLEWSMNKSHVEYTEWLCAENKENFWHTTASADLQNITLPLSKANLTVSFDYPTNFLKDIILNCTLQTNETIKEWRWETRKQNGRVWTVPIGDIITSTVIQNDTSACQLSYSILHRALKPTDVNQTYRCYVVTAAGPLMEMAAYYVVPESAVPGSSNRTDGRSFMLDEDAENFETNANRNTDNFSPMLAVMGVVGLVAVALGVTAFYTRSRPEKQSKDETWMQDFMNKLDGLSTPKPVTLEASGPSDEDDKLSQVSSTMASGDSTSLASSVATSAVSEDTAAAQNLTLGMGSTRGTGLAISLTGTDAEAKAGDSVHSLVGSVEASEAELFGSEAGGSEAAASEAGTEVSAAPSDLASEAGGVAGNEAGSEDRVSEAGRGGE